MTTDTDTLVARLRECADCKSSEAWRRLDGGQDLCIGSMLADEAADRIEAIEAQIARLTAERDARDRAKVAEGLRMAAELTRYDTDYCDRLGGMSKMVEEPEGEWINRDAILSRAKDMEAGNG